MHALESTHESAWPIRAGGEYAPRYVPEARWRIRVTAIDGDRIYTVLRSHRGGCFIEHGPEEIAAQLFRLAYLPEDQSPLHQFRSLLERAAENLGQESPLTAEIQAALAEGSR